MGRIRPESSHHQWLDSHKSRWQRTYSKACAAWFINNNSGYGSSSDGDFFVNVENGPDWWLAAPITGLTVGNTYTVYFDARNRDSGGSGDFDVSRQQHGLPCGRDGRFQHHRGIHDLGREELHFVANAAIDVPDDFQYRQSLAAPASWWTTSASFPSPPPRFSAVSACWRSCVAGGDLWVSSRCKSTCFGVRRDAIAPRRFPYCSGSVILKICVIRGFQLRT